MSAVTIKQSARLRAVSYLNVLLCLLVVFIHVSSHPVSTLDKKSLAFALVYIPWRFSSFAVPGFIFLGGLRTFLKPPDQNGWRAFYLGRARRVFLPYLVWSVVYYTYFVLRGFDTLSLSRFAYGLATATIFGPFYFIIVILQFYLLTPLWKRVTERVSPKIAVPVAVVATPLFYLNFPYLLRAINPSWDFMYTDRLFLTYLAYFVIGCYAGSRYEAFVQCIRRRLGALAAAFLLLCALDIGLGWAVYTGRLAFPLLEYVHYLYCLSAVAFLMAAFSAHEGKLPCPRLLRAVDEVSFSIYLLHGLIIYLCNEWMAYLGIRRIGAQYALRTVFVYTATIALCVGSRALSRRLIGRKRSAAP
ncbi:MAG: acyltransferase [Clostridiales bacterium]|nr:acyltransferase [Clostridiales bacterium]